MARAAANKPDVGYTAVVYAHGMGTQRRFQETGRLLDALDTYQYSAFHGRNEKLGRLLEIEPKEEAWFAKVAKANGANGQVPFVQLIYKASSAHPGQEVRFYEIYWADLMDEGGVMDVLKWIGLQALRPFRWWLAPWRSFHRQRRAVLAEMYESALERGEAQSQADMKRLLVWYQEFDRLDVKRKYPGGDFADFLSYVGDQTADDKAKARLVKAAQDWQKAERATELGNAVGILSIIVAIAVVFGGLLWTIAQVFGSLRNLVASHPGPVWEELLTILPDPGWAALPGMGLSVLLSLGLWDFLSRSMADVAAWTTFAEAEKGHAQRKAVLEVGRTVMQQVLSDKTCNRVVVVGHSLGTSVACDTILSLARANRVRKNSAGEEPLEVPLTPISHLVTLASPIDKISYFFERHVASHRFARVLEELRGDLGKPPFSSVNGSPMTRWINFWDEADPISGPLHSQVSRTSLEPRIENVHVPSLAFPLPGTAHSAYFENRKVIATLFDVIFRPERLPQKPETGPSPFDQTPPGQAKSIFALALSVPWLGLVAVVSYWIDWDALSWAAAGGAIALMLLLGIAFLVRRRGNRDPL